MDLSAFAFKPKPKQTIDPSQERWVSWEEWRWRETDRIFDEARYARIGRRPSKADLARREESLRSYLASSADCGED